MQGFKRLTEEAKTIARDRSRGFQERLKNWQVPDEHTLMCQDEDVASPKAELVTMWHRKL